MNTYEITNKTIHKQISENTDDVYWLRSNEKIIYINPVFEKVWGIPCCKIYQNTQFFIESIHCEDKSKVLKFIDSDSFAKTDCYTYQYRIKRPDKEIIWMETKSFPILNENGQTVSRVEISSDITQQKKSHTETNLLTEIFDEAPNSIIVHDIAGKILFANKKTLEIHGYTEKEFINLNLYELNTQKSADLIKDKIKTILENRPSKFEVEQYKKDGTLIPLEVFIKPVEWNSKAALLNIATDITKHKKAEEELKRKNFFINSLLKAIPVAVFFKDKQGRYLGCNPIFSDVMGVTEEEIKGKTAFELWPGKMAEKYHNMDLELMESRKHQIYEFEVKGKNGKTKPVIFGKDVFIDEKGNVVGLVGAFVDISKQKALENNLIKLKEKAEESDNLKTAFLHNISHEIRTPLNGIIGFSELLKDDDICCEKIKEYSNIIINSGWKLSNIINDLVSIATIESGQAKANYTKTDISELLKNIYSNFRIKAKDKGIAFYLKDELNNLKFISTDETKLYEIISNLIINAFKFTNDGFIEFGASIKEDKLQFYVRDTGIGIKKEDQEIIFKRFAQVNSSNDSFHQGSGLGLSICKAYVELLGGTIRLESETQKGTTFHFNIPLIPIIDVNHNKLTLNKINDKTTILLAEDDEINYLYFAEILNGLNINLLHAKNGSEAVDICMQEQKIDMIFMDIKMPVMNGHEATKKIKTLKPEIPIIAISAYFEDKEKEISNNMGCIDYLTKPVTKEDVLDSIKKINKGAENHTI